MSDSQRLQQGNVTALLRRVQAGDSEAENSLLPLIYAEMRQVAARLMIRERREHTLQPTALVNEAYLRLFKIADLSYQNRAHFFAIAARTMRQILVDSARARGAAKRGGAWERLELDLTGVKGVERHIDVLALDEALGRLKARAPRPCRVVEMIFFGGMGVADAAVVLGVSEKTVKRDWKAAKSWLFNEIYGEADFLGPAQ